MRGVIMAAITSKLEVATRGFVRQSNVERHLAPPRISPTAKEALALCSRTPTSRPADGEFAGSTHDRIHRIFHGIRLSPEAQPILFFFIARTSGTVQASVVLAVNSGQSQRSRIKNAIATSWLDEPSTGSGQGDER